MTSPNDNSLIDLDDPLGLTALPTSDDLAWREQQEQVKQHCAEEYSSSPLWRARAEKDPEYWNKFSPGGVR